MNNQLATRQLIRLNNTQSLFLVRRDMALAKLPSSVMRHIAKRLDTERDISNFARTCRRHFHLLNPLLYEYNITYSQNSSLIWAAENGRKGTLQCAIASGIPVTDSQLGLLHKAAAQGQNDFISVLIEVPGLDINDWDYDGYTALHYAVQRCRIEVVKLLLRHGASPVQPSKSKDYVLNTAIEKGYIEIATYILSYTHELSTACAAGWTPLHYAANKGCTGLVIALIDRGADVARLTNNGWSPMALALRNSHKAAIKVLLDRGCS